MKSITSIILILLFLVSSCIVPQQDSADIKPSDYNKTEDIEKPKVSENKTLPKKEKLEDSIN